VTNKSSRNSLLHKEIIKGRNLILTSLDYFENKFLKKFIMGEKKKEKKKQNKT